MCSPLGRADRLQFTPQAISLASHDAGLALVQSAASGAALQVILQHASDKHKDARRGSAEFIHAMLEVQRTPPQPVSCPRVPVLSFGACSPCLVSLATLGASLPPQAGFNESLSPQQLQGIINALKTLVADADAPVRAAAGKTFWGVHARFPSEASALLSKLDASRQKAIGRLKPSS